MAARKRSRGRRRQADNYRKKKLKMAALLTVAGLVIVFGGVYLALRSYVGKTDKDAICNNIFIGTMDVSGMTQAEA